MDEPKENYKNHIFNNYYKIYNESIAVKRILLAFIGLLLLLIIKGHLYSNELEVFDDYVNSLEELSGNGQEFTKQKLNPINCTPKLGKHGQFNLVYLLSLPGSGNTWTRFLIEQSTGYLTGSVYNDGGLKKALKGEFEDPNDNKTIVVKNHNPHLGGPVPAKNGKPAKPGYRNKVSGCIFIIRDLVDSILADFTRASNGNKHTAELDESLLGGEKWHKHVKRLSSRFSTMYGLGTKNICHGNAFIINYEEMKKSSENQIKIMEGAVNFLNEMNENELDSPKIDFQTQKYCLQKQNEGNYHRKHKVKTWDVHDFFEEDEKILVNDAIKRANRSLIENFGMKNGGLSETYLFDVTKMSKRSAADKIRRKRRKRFIRNRPKAALKMEILGLS